MSASAGDGWTGLGRAGLGCAAAMLLVATLSTAAFAADTAARPAALLESLSAPLESFAEMDYLRPGTTLALAPQQTVVLDYLASCTRETTTGGTLTVGEQQSSVSGGKVDRQKAACAGEALQLAAYQADVGGVTTMRGLTSNRLQVATTSPVLLLKEAEAVRIEQLNGDGAVFTVPPGTVRRLNVASAQAPRYLLDLAAEHVRLQPGALYRATQGRKHVDFAIADTAVDSKGPLIGRLLPL